MTKKPIIYIQEQLKPTFKDGSKLKILIDLLQEDAGATIAEMVAASGWQAHSIRGAISGTFKKKFGLNITSIQERERGRVYRLMTDVKEMNNG